MFCCLKYHLYRSLKIFADELFIFVCFFPVIEVFVHFLVFALFYFLIHFFVDLFTASHETFKYKGISK